MKEIFKKAPYIIAILILLNVNYLYSEDDGGVETREFKIIREISGKDLGLNNLQISRVSYSSDKFVIFDHAHNNYLLVGYDGKLLHSWQTTSNEKVNNIYLDNSERLFVQTVGEGMRMNCYKLDGTLIDSFKDYSGILQFSVSEDGNILESPIVPRRTKSFEIVREYTQTGMIMKKYLLEKSKAHYPHILNYGFFAPLIQGNNIYVLSTHFPEILVFSLESGKCENSIIINDKTLASFAKKNIGGFNETGIRHKVTQVVYNVRMFGECFVLSTKPEGQPNIWFMVINKRGEVINKYYIDKTTHNDVMSPSDFNMFINEGKVVLILPKRNKNKEYSLLMFEETIKE